MNIDDLKALARRKPFRQFVINLVDGKAVHIDAESELLFPKKRPELVIVFDADGSQHQLESEAIASLTGP